MTDTISKSKLKTKMLEIFHELESSGDELVVTAYGKPVLEIVPIKQKVWLTDVFGDFLGQVTYLEDINAPTFLE